MAFSYSPRVAGSNLQPLIVEIFREDEGVPLETLGVTVLVNIQDQATKELIVTNGIAQAVTDRPGRWQYVFTPEQMTGIDTNRTWLVEWTVKLGADYIFRNPELGVIPIKKSIAPPEPIPPVDPPPTDPPVDPPVEPPPPPPPPPPIEPIPVMYPPGPLYPYPLPPSLAPHSPWVPPKPLGWPVNTPWPPPRPLDWPSNVMWPPWPAWPPPPPGWPAGVPWPPPPGTPPGPPSPPANP